MNITDFKSRYGSEPLKVTNQFLTKTVARNYTLEDSIIELVDNSLDARINGENSINVKIIFDSINHTLTIEDNGTGIKDFNAIMELGNSNKTNDLKNKYIGKYGIGVKGAVSSIASKNRYNDEDISVVTFKSYYNGIEGTKCVAYDKDGSVTIGKTNLTSCDINLHGTIISFNNIVINSSSYIIYALEEVFELPLSGYNNFNLNIEYNGRRIGYTGKKTFIGDESNEIINVGDDTVNAVYRIIGGKSKDDRAFEEAALRIYDKATGRLLGKSNDYWYWFANKKAQQNICGIRMGIFIESNINTYNKFGIKPEKNGVNYRKFFRHEEFKDLSEYLRSVYNQAAKSSPNTDISVQKYCGRTFQPVTKTGSNSLYDMIGDIVYYKPKYKTTEIIEIINENITLKNKLNKKSKKNIAI